MQQQRRHQPPQLKFPILAACHFDMLHLLNRVGLVFQTPNLAHASDA